MRFHWQNLSDEPGRERRGFWYGRAWWRFGDDEHRQAYPFQLRLEWHHGRIGLACDLSLDRDEREATLHLAGPGFSWFISTVLPKPVLDRLPFSYRRGEYNYMGGHRSIGVRGHDGALWFSLWEDSHEWRASDPWWQRAKFGLDDVANFLFGKTQYSTRELEKREVNIPMPEGSYPATIAIEASSWIRPRWPWRPFSKFRIGTDVKIPAGIPIPGKGENSWDCGDDAIYGMGSNEPTIEGAIGKVIASALKTRKRHGWPGTTKP